MPLQTINLGILANDGTGDDLRTAFEKVINNFDYINQRVESVAAVTLNGENVGGGLGIFKSNNNNTLEFRTLVAGNGINLAIDGNNIVVAFNPINSTSFNGQNILDVGNLYLSSNKVMHGNVTGNVTGNLIGNVTGNVTGNLIGNVTGLVSNVDVAELEREVTTFDFGPVNNKSFSSAIEYLLHKVGADFGTITTPAALSIDGGNLV